MFGNKNIIGEGHRFKKGDIPWNYKGGRSINHRGYVMVAGHNHPSAYKNGMIYEHRLIIEGILKRYLDKDEVVHHINGNKSDNRIENLYLFASKTEHKRYHKLVSLNKFLKEQMIIQSNLLNIKS